jgi:hypothetical protein
MAFDIAEQDAIRRKLIAYSKAHRIGVIRLARRIQEADSKGIAIPVKTLQRFMGGDRVNDAALNACARFADKVDDPITALGDYLSRIYGTPIVGDLGNHDFTIIRNGIECPVTVTREGNFWRMIERDRSSHRIYEGVLIYTAGTKVAFLKDRAFSLPRTYHLTSRWTDPVYFCDCQSAGELEQRWR